MKENTVLTNSSASCEPPSAASNSVGGVERSFSAAGKAVSKTEIGHPEAR